MSYNWGEKIQRLNDEISVVKKKLRKAVAVE
jgi:hypothetical protein